MTAPLLPESFAGKYLYFGASSPLLSSATPEASFASPFRAINRTIYVFGVSIVGPCGMLYHLAAAAKNHIQSSSAVDEKQKKQLKERCLQHLNAASLDGIAFLSTLGGTILTVIIVASSYFTYQGFLSNGEILLGIVLLSRMYYDGGFDNLFFRFIKTPFAFHDYFVDKPLEGEVVSQKEYYQTHYLYKNFVREGIATKEPLTNNHLESIAHSIRNAEDYHSFISIAEECPIIAQMSDFYQLLLDMNRIKPELKDRATSIIGKRAQFALAWQESMRNARGKDKIEIEKNMQEAFIRKAKAIFKDILNIPGFASLRTPIELDQTTLLKLGVD